MLWEILHRAAPCRNVPVTFTLEPTRDIYVSDDTRKSKAASGYRKARKELDAAIEERNAIPDPTPNEPKHRTARRARAAKNVAAASVKVAHASHEELDANMPAAPAKSKPIGRL